MPNLLRVFLNPPTCRAYPRSRNFTYNYSFIHLSFYSFSKYLHPGLEVQTMLDLKKQRGRMGSILSRKCHAGGWRQVCK